MSERGRYRKLFTGLWSRPEFTSLTDAEKVVAFYLLTGQQTNRIGLYKLSPAQAAEDLGTTPESFRKRLGTVCASFGWLFDADARVFFIPSWWRWNPPANENVTRGNLKDLVELPPCALVEAFSRNTETIPERFRESFIQELREQLPSGFRNQDQEAVSVKKQKQNQRAAREDGSDEEHVPYRENEPTSGRQAKLEGLARKALSFGDPDGDFELLIDSFFVVARTENVKDVRRVDAVQALNNALSERRVN